MLLQLCEHCLLWAGLAPVQPFTSSDGDLVARHGCIMINDVLDAEQLQELRNVVDEAEPALCRFFGVRAFLAVLARISMILLLKI